MADINSCVFTGRLGSDVELKQTTTGKTVATFSLAVGGYHKDETNWLDFEAWGKTAEALAQYRHKGDSVGVTAHAVVDHWEKDGQKHNRVKFVVDSAPLNAGSCKHQQQAPQQPQVTQQAQPPQGGDAWGAQQFGSYGDPFGGDTAF